jgi:hypothetical protein
MKNPLKMTLCVFIYLWASTTPAIKPYSIKGEIISNLSVKDSNISFLVKSFDNKKYLFSMNYQDKKPLSKYTIGRKLFGSKFLLSHKGDFYLVINEKGNLYEGKNLIDTQIKLHIPIKQPPLIEESKKHYISYVVENYDIFRMIFFNKFNDNIHKVTIEQIPNYTSVHYRIPTNVLIHKKYFFMGGKNGSINAYEKLPHKKIKKLWLLDFGAPYEPVMKFIFYKGEPHILVHNHKGGQMVLYNIKGILVWEISINTTFLSLQYLNEKIYLINTQQEMEVINIHNGLIIEKTDLKNKLKDQISQKDSITSIYYFFLLKDQFVIFTNIGIFIFYEEKCKKINLLIDYKNSIPVQESSNQPIFFTIKNILYKLY